MAHRINGQLIPVGGGDPIPLIRENLVVGRLESCDIRLRFPNVSKRHCQFLFESGLWWIEDLGSTNGIKVNSVRINNKRVLHPEDVITIAKRDFTVDYDPPVGQNTLEELLEDDPMSQPLLEKAGLVRPERYSDRPREPVNPMRRLLEEEDDD